MIERIKSLKNAVMSAPFIGHPGGHVSDRIDRSWRSLGGDLRQAPMSHLSAIVELTPYDVFVIDYDYGLLSTVVWTAPPWLMFKPI